MTCLCGNVEGADLKQDNQSTTHIDPSTKECRRLWLAVCPRGLATSGSAGKVRYLLTVCLTKVHTIDWNPLWCFNPIEWILIVGITHHKPLPKKHVSYPRLTTTKDFRDLLAWCCLNKKQQSRNFSIWDPEGVKWKERYCDVPGSPCLSKKADQMYDSFSL